MDLDVKEIKAFSKSKGCTLNDYIVALLSTALYEYFDRRKDQWDGVIPDFINMGMPISLRPPADKLEDVRMKNEFTTHPVTLPIRKDLHEVLPTM